MLRDRSHFWDRLGPELVRILVLGLATLLLAPALLTLIGPIIATW